MAVSLNDIKIKLHPLVLVKHNAMVSAAKLENRARAMICNDSRYVIN